MSNKNKESDLDAAIAGMKEIEDGLTPKEIGKLVSKVMSEHPEVFLGVLKLLKDVEK